MKSNFHKEAFDDATLLKLDIYRRYLEEWLPVFATRERFPSWNGQINIFDFFCGPGQDIHGKSGSPLIAIDECKKYIKLLEKNNRSVNLYFNDSRPKKIKQLDEILSSKTIPEQIITSTSSDDFIKSLMKNIKTISGAANLIFIDQCGIKEVPDNVFNALIGLHTTDFLFFIASSSFARFDFTNHVDSSNHINKNTKHVDKHRQIAKMYRSWIPAKSDYYIAPFTLKKSSNIYGLIFGTSHLLGILKFMQVCWKIDPERGDSNFDIDDDKMGHGDTLDLFKDNTKSKKVVVFQKQLREKLLDGKFSSDKSIFIYALENGFLPTDHAKSILVELIKEGKIQCDGRPRLSKNCLDGPRTIKLC